MLTGALGPHYCCGVLHVSLPTTRHRSPGGVRRRREPKYRRADVRGAISVDGPGHCLRMRETDPYKGGGGGVVKALRDEEP